MYTIRHTIISKQGNINFIATLNEYETNTLALDALMTLFEYYKKSSSTIVNILADDELGTLVLNNRAGMQIYQITKK